MLLDPVTMFEPVDVVFFTADWFKTEAHLDLWFRTWSKAACLSFTVARLNENGDEVDADEADPEEVVVDVDDVDDDGWD